MNATIKRILFWSPRILCVLFALFVSIFALDVFELGYSLPETILALLIHLIPTYLIIIALIVAWRWEWIGAILFGVLALLYLLLSWERLPATATSCLWLPLILIGILFLLNWKFKTQLAKTQTKREMMRR